MCRPAVFDCVPAQLSCLLGVSRPVDTCMFPLGSTLFGPAIIIDIPPADLWTRSSRIVSSPRRSPPAPSLSSGKAAIAKALPTIFPSWWAKATTSAVVENRAQTTNREKAQGEQRTDDTARRRRFDWLHRGLDPSGQADIQGYRPVPVAAQMNGAGCLSPFSGRWLGQQAGVC